MCGSVGFTGGGSSALSFFTNAISGIAQQQRSSSQAKAEIEVRKRQADDAYARRVRNAILNIQESTQAQQQANEQSTQSKMEIAREMLKAREAAKANASASGISGNVVNRLMTDISVTEQQKKAIVDSNRDNAVLAQQLQKHKAIEAAYRDTIYYTEPEGIFNSMLGLIPGLFSNLSFSWPACGTTSSKKSSCG